MKLTYQSLYVVRLVSQSMWRYIAVLVSDGLTSPFIFDQGTHNYNGHAIFVCNKVLTAMMFLGLLAKIFYKE